MYQEVTKEINFMWPVGQIFDEINLTSMYAARNKAPIDPKNLGADGTDDYAISEEEKEFVMSNLSDAIHELFGVFIRQSRSIQDSVFCDKEIIFATKTYIGCGFSITRHVDSAGNSIYNPNRLVLLDIDCLQYLSCYLLRNWWETVKCGDDLAIYQNKLDESQKRIKKHLFELSKPFYKKDYSIVKA